MFKFVAANIQHGTHPLRKTLTRDGKTTSKLSRKA